MGRWPTSFSGSVASSVRLLNEQHRCESLPPPSQVFRDFPRVSKSLPPDSTCLTRVSFSKNFTKNHLQFYLEAVLMNVKL